MSKRTLPALTIVFTVFGLSRACADDQAEQLLKASHDYVATRSVEIQQTVEQTTRISMDGKPAGDARTTKQSSLIEIDAGKQIMRLTTKDQSGKELVVIRQGKNIAMKIGSEPWTAPQGQYARIGDQLANPFACPLPQSGKEQSPRWTVVGPEVLDGKETTVIETVGDTANAYAQERIREGMATMFPEAASRPAIEVLAYKSRHWIETKDNRRLRVDQTSRQQMTMTGGLKAVIDITARTTAIYGRYDDVKIQVPKEARLILGPG